jgi:hypothetical protein
MERVYRNAELTIIAGRVADSRTGFIANPIANEVLPCALPYARSTPEPAAVGEVFIDLPSDSSLGPVESRGLCFQEAILSRRAVRYGTQQLSFVCKHRSA